MQGCDLVTNGQKEYVDGTCIDGEVLCETCDLTFFETTEFYTSDDSDGGDPSKIVVGDELMTQLGAP